VVARRRVGPVLALAPALLLLFLGTAWEVILWPFEIQFLIPAAAGLGVLLALERGDLRGDLAAGGLLVLAFGSGSTGVPIAAGASVEILLQRGRVARLLRVVAPPVALYVIWLYEYDPYRHQYGSIGSVPKFAAEQLGSVLAGLAGFRYGTVRTPALVAFQLVRRREGRPRLAALAAMALTYWGRPSCIALGCSTSSRADSCTPAASSCSLSGWNWSPASASGLAASRSPGSRPR
jgi:hypothetical protein